MSRRAERARLAIAAEAGVVALAAAGDADAFHELVLRREAGVRDLLRRLSGDAALADDLAQQAFLQAWRALPGLRQPGAFGGWLRRLAVNVWLQHARRTNLETEELDDETPDLAPVRPAAADRVDLERALARLKPAERLCVVLSYAGSLSHGEIAETAGLPLGTVKSHVARGGEKLRAWLSLGDAS